MNIENQHDVLAAQLPDLIEKVGSEYFLLIYESPGKISYTRRSIDWQTEVLYIAQLILEKFTEKQLERFFWILCSLEKVSTHGMISWTSIIALLKIKQHRILESIIRTLGEWEEDTIIKKSYGEELTNRFKK